MMLSEIAEMTMTSPGSMSSTGLPHYPWSISEIEDLPEKERKLYLELLRDTRKEWQKAAEKLSTKR